LVYHAILIFLPDDLTNEIGLNKTVPSEYINLTSRKMKKSTTPDVLNAIALLDAVLKAGYT